MAPLAADRAAAGSARQQVWAVMQLHHRFSRHPTCLTGRACLGDALLRERGPAAAHRQACALADRGGHNTQNQASTLPPARAAANHHSHEHPTAPSGRRARTWGRDESRAHACWPERGACTHRKLSIDDSYARLSSCGAAGRPHTAASCRAFRRGARPPPPWRPALSRSQQQGCPVNSKDKGKVWPAVPPDP